MVGADAVRFPGAMAVGDELSVYVDLIQQGRTSLRLKAEAIGRERDGDKETIRFTLRDGDSGDANPLGGDYPPIIFIDGVRSDRATVDEIDPNTIDTIEVLKGDKAVEEYGDDAKGGVIKVFMK